ncbi:MAG: hypothetical protein AAB676_03385 [Verrucomicrobiota bacterium]
MSISAGFKFWLAGWFAVGGMHFGAAQILIEGVQDRQVYADRVSFRVPAQAGYEDVVLLNARAVSASVWVEVNQADYYALQVRRASVATGTVETRLVRFIVRSSERGDSEWGLPPWTPYPLINSASNELAGAHLRLIAPQDFPMGLEIPVVAWIENSEGRAVRANGLLRAAGHPAIQLRRGVGSGFLSEAHPAGPLQYAGDLSGLHADKIINLESNTVWTPVSGTISGEVIWPLNSRVAVAGSVTIPASSTLTIEAGTIVRLNAGVDVVVQGRLVIRGAMERPVVFTPTARTQPWGGFILRTSAAQLEATGAIFTGSGANANWFDENSGYDVHRKEQALFLIDGARATLTDCSAFDHAGQFGHGKNGYVSLTRCLVQKFITAGEYNSGSVQIDQSALIEFPQDDGLFADDDNDGIYFTSGSHVIRNSLVGWAKDDGIDAGSGGAGSVLASNVWVEACYHEGFAWSGQGRVVTNLHCVAINCGQGIEAGWSDSTGSPDVFADHCLSIGNLSGARFGDNYDWSYDGFLRVTNSFLLFNYRDIFGLTWTPGAWTNELDQMDLQGNFLSAADTNHPNNALWQPVSDGWRLADFLTTPPGSTVGIGFATRSAQFDLAKISNAIPVRLSTFSTNFVAVDYVVSGQPADGSEENLAVGTVQFAPGETVKNILLPMVDPLRHEFVFVALRNPVQAELTGRSRLYFFRSLAAASQALIRAGSDWRYLDDGSDQGTAWRGLEFVDRNWKIGMAELGYGDEDENTMVRSNRLDGTRIITTYFRHPFMVSNPSGFSTLTVRLRRDDGGVVYLNGQEVFRSNMTNGPAVPITSANLAGNNTDSETAFYSTNAKPALLQAGANVVAVEIHQQSLTSSDISFDLELIGVPFPRLQLLRSDNELLLFWAETTAVLEQADIMTGPWNTVTSASSPRSVTPTQNQKFYRARQR